LDSTWEIGRIGITRTAAANKDEKLPHASFKLSSKKSKDAPRTLCTRNLNSDVPTKSRLSSVFHFEWFRCHTEGETVVFIVTVPQSANKANAIGLFLCCSKIVFPTNTLADPALQYASVTIKRQNELITFGETRKCPDCLGEHILYIQAKHTIILLHMEREYACYGYKPPFHHRRATPRPRPLNARWAAPGGARGPGLG
jgi:hypothetical protein